MGSTNTKLKEALRVLFELLDNGDVSLDAKTDLVYYRLLKILPIIRKKAGL